MRRMLAFLFLPMLLALLLAACGDTSGSPTAAPTTAQATAAPQSTATARPTSPPQPSAAPVSSGQLAMGVPTLSASDLILTEGNGTLYLDALYDRQVGRDDNGLPDGTQGFVTSWTVDATAKIWTYKVRTDVVYHNGDKANSKDIKGNITRTMDPSSKRANTFARDVASMETPDDQTFVYTLKVKSLAVPTFGNAALLEPNDYITSKGRDFANKNPVGSGAYKFKSLVLDDRINYEAVEKHWLFGVPRTKTLIFRSIPEETTRVALLQNGDIDFATLSRAAAPPVRATKGLRVLARPDSGITTIVMESQWVTEYPGYGKNPLSELRVRQALNWYAIDREKLVRTFLEGAGKPFMSYPVSPFDPAYKELPLPVPSQDKAKALLKEAGYEKGFELDMNIWPRPAIPEGIQMMEAIAVWWEQLGIKVNRKPMEYSAYNSTMVAGQGKALGAFAKPTVSGMYYLGNNNPQAATGKGSVCSPPFPVFGANRNPRACELGKAWEDANNIEEYKVRGQAWMQYKYEQSEDPVLTTVGDLFGVGAKMPEKWNPGKDSFSYRLERAAAIRY